MKTKKNYFKIILLGLILVVMSTTGFSCIESSTEEEAVEIPTVNLTYWRVWDSSDKFSEVISAYEAKYPYVNISYRKLRYEEFEQALLEAWARGAGPDIISIHNTWMERYLSDLSPMPAQVSMSKLATTGPSWRQREEIVTQTKSLPTLNDIKTDFVDVVSDDVVYGGQIYGLPMSVDSLVMYYNEDLLNNAGIAYPPTNWTDFKEAVKELTILNEDGDIVQSGTALGTANNIPRSMDILSLLMMQNGTSMIDNGKVVFDEPSADRPNYYPGREALRFYTDFADPTKEVYSWNSSMDNALTAFTSGKVAFFFGYAFHLDEIKAKAPKLNLGVSTMPQIEGNVKQVNYASYWVETVPLKSTHKQEAWDFIAFATAKENVVSYLDSAKRPTAIKSLISTQLSDLEMAPFAKQTLTADSWYQGKGAEYVEDVFANMIGQVNAGSNDYENILSSSVSRINSAVY